MIKILQNISDKKSNNTANVTNIPITDPAKIYQNVNKTKPLVYYAHGYTSGPSDESVQTIIEAHLKRGSDNIFIIDWSKLASGEYNVVLGRIKSISKIIARSFDEVVKLGLNIEKFHFVGHSMGAQIAGFVGKYSDNSIPRITGLDPALPGFYHTGFGHIDKDSARFVDIIHTDGGHYGVMSDTGTVDFYANGGHRPQPGCESLDQLVPPNDFCSHRKAWKYYAQTVNNNTIFTATECSRHDLYKSGSCDLNKKVPCGYATPTDIKFSNTANVVDISFTDPAKIYQHVDKTKPLIYYAHGYIGHPSDKSVQTIIEAYLKRGSDNIFIVDWSKLASGDYNVVLGRIKDVSKIIARSLDEVVKLGLDIEKFHFIGHSMGAQIAGFVGKYSNNLIPRITGLDPAFPGFYNQGIGHIDKNSARFVDIIHTDAGDYGAPSNTGTVDFYANGGHNPQPGCGPPRLSLEPSDSCSHEKAPAYYAQTINNNKIFTATKCFSYGLYKLGLCNLNKKVPVGYATPTDM
ncbi:phospholipase A1 member A-like [Aphidius gifuensis]|uniref:phospholipase A1 member A-like n=1 Tax=Aphidius gifuensis TaxID=684658 RepID=UPI001CDBF537|nr:phospholipase A1 member A-like [Aphidius gifuensis]